MFTMSPFWEKFWYIFTWVTQGTSYLNARAYAILHRMHHAYSDTEKDPHTPHFFKEAFTMNPFINFSPIQRCFPSKNLKPVPNLAKNYPNKKGLRFLKHKPLIM